jgi:hypothetical protein
MSDKKLGIKLYEALSTPPQDAIREIKGGNLKGFSDINPQWRTEVVTREIGLCGIDWKFEVADTFTQVVEATGEVLVFVKVAVYIKDADEWSAPIYGFGGDYLVKKDRNGVRGNDEGMKMAVTDALGTALKMIGVGADIYRGLVKNGVSDSKYARQDVLQRDAFTIQNQQNQRKAEALKKLTAEMKRIGAQPDEVSALAGLKYNKITTKEMTAEEVEDLALNLEHFIKEQMGIEG